MTTLYATTDPNAPGIVGRLVQVPTPRTGRYRIVPVEQPCPGGCEDGTLYTRANDTVPGPNGEPMQRGPEPCPDPIHRKNPLEQTPTRETTR